VVLGVDGVVVSIRRLCGIVSVNEDLYKQLLLDPEQAFDRNYV
jgi:hypothetical protein